MSAFISPFHTNPGLRFASTSFCTRPPRCPLAFNTSVTRPLKCVATSDANQSVPLRTAPETKQLVEDLLIAVKGTDRGSNVSSSKREAIDAIIEKLMKIGASQAITSDPGLFSRYTVAYTSKRQKSPPAGGLFRSNIGRILFPARGLFQHVLEPGTVINLVCFRVLGILKGCVSLRGSLHPIADSNMGPNAVKVEFDRPRLKLGPAVFQFGPKTEVRLVNTYLDDRVRLAVGSRGSLFVFAKDELSVSKMGAEWESLWKAKPLPVSVLIISALLISGILLSGTWPVRGITLLLVILFFSILKTGGVAMNSATLTKEEKN